MRIEVTEEAVSTAKKPTKGLNSYSVHESILDRTAVKNIMEKAISIVSTAETIDEDDDHNNIVHALKNAFLISKDTSFEYSILVTKGIHQKEGKISHLTFQLQYREIEFKRVLKDMVKTYADFRPKKFHVGHLYLMMRDVSTDTTGHTVYTWDPVQFSFEITNRETNISIPKTRPQPIGAEPQIAQPITRRSSISPEQAAQMAEETETKNAIEKHIHGITAKYTELDKSLFIENIVEFIKNKGGKISYSAIDRNNDPTTITCEAKLELKHNRILIKGYDVAFLINKKVR
jgi:hypothetical protein